MEKVSRATGDIFQSLSFTLGMPRERRKTFRQIPRLRTAAQKEAQLKRNLGTATTRQQFESRLGTQIG